MRVLFAPDRALALALATARRLQPRFPGGALPAASTRIRVGILGTALAILALLAGGDQGYAAPAIVFNVNGTPDAEDASLADNKCDVNLIAPGDQCTLRAAVSQSNSTAGVQTINVPAGTYNLTLANSLNIADEVTINGAGSHLVLAGAGALSLRVFDVAALGVEIGGMTIQNGKTSEASPDGGGIHNHGGLTLTSVVVSNNEARDRGGGIYNTGALTLVDSTVRNNTAFGFGGGGGIYSDEAASLTITNSTVSANTAGGMASGGGIDNRGLLTLTDTVMSGNSAGSGGGIRNRGTATLEGVLLDGNSATMGSGGGMRNEMESVLTLTASTVSNNWAHGGGGAIWHEGTATVAASTISGNTTSGRGGGIATDEDATLTLENTTLSGNTAEGWGGGISTDEDAHTTITDSAITGNSAQSGGGISNRAIPMLTVSDTLVSANTASGDGGGIHATDAATTNIIGSTIYDNDATGDGGGVFNELSAIVVITDSEVSNNTAGGSGAGVFSSTAVDGHLNVRNSTITGNHAFGTGSVGGGIYACGTAAISNSTVSGNDSQYVGGIAVGDIAEECAHTLTLTNATVTDNSSDGDGTGLGLYLASGGTVVLENTIIAGNPGLGAECDGAASITSQGYNISTDASCDLTGPGDFENTDPSFGPLADNGGPTLTHALLPGSPAIDGGSPDCPPPASDQRGVSRPLDGDGDGTALCDIGAYEAPALGTPTTTSTPTPTPTATPTSTPTTSPTPTPTGTPPDVLVGDADCDGSVDSVDALWVLRDVAGMEATAACLDAANVKCDDALTSVDALFILRFVASLPNNLPAGCPPIGP